ncbi:unnamed protein product [Psylliodes chrysocephalus]|uniref:Uncharacterized protein n=1 Tax=Psylliodes chrysocephalus TaxID=3402493 RepID=A0A9P0CX34_9CUCU|nr:unnamed protein product [Psylliodes chrysocephala]
MPVVIFLYTKCGPLYLMDMYSLKEKTNPTKYRSFTDGGRFAIKRSDKFWYGTWSGMVIEKSLMRTMKTVGGLTRGRGVQESVLSRWIMRMSFSHNICDVVENFSI